MSRAPGADQFVFPEGFLWGAATAAHQIEGSPMADGAGASIWTRFGHTPGMMLNGDTGDVACDHYNRWREDVKLMRSSAFRRTASRVVVAGAARGRRPGEPEGLDFYRNWSTNCSQRHRAAGAPCSIGTCPRRWTTAAAGSTARSPTGSPSTPR